MQPRHRLRGLRFSVGIAHSLSAAAAAFATAAFTLTTAALALTSAALAAAAALAYEVDSSFGRIVLRGHLRWAVHH